MGVHLVVLIHGLYGSPKNLAVIHEELVKAGEEDDRAGHKVQTVVHVCKSFTGSHTWDGIDVNAWKASKEVDEVIERLEGEGRKVERFSVFGYSLGGLVARYLVGLLHARSPSFFDQHKPSSFSTAATPHLGVLKYQTTSNTLIHTIGRRLFSRSGQQLYCLDKDWEGRCLLEVLADPDHIFLHAVKTFPRVNILANGCHDLTVPYPTATFSLSDPFEAFEATGMQVDVDENHVVRSWHHPEQPVATALLNEDRTVRRRPPLPPFLFLPYPFTYLLFLLLPLILPLWICFVSCVLIIHTIQSRRRHRAHTLQLIPHPDSESATTPLLAPSISHLRLQALKTSPSSMSVDSDRPRSEYSAQSTPSGSSTPRMVDMDVPGDVPPRAGQTALLLTPAQKRMSKNLEAELQHANRIIAWYPWAFNSHGLLVARDAKRFKWHEEGRGIMRLLAKNVVESAVCDEAT